MKVTPETNDIMETLSYLEVRLKRMIEIATRLMVSGSYEATYNFVYSNRVKKLMVEIEAILGRTPIQGTTDVTYFYKSKAKARIEQLKRAHRTLQVAQGKRDQT